MLLQTLFFMAALSGTQASGHASQDIADPIEAIERTDAMREGRQRAAQIAAVYWGHEALAETLHEAQMEIGFINDTVARVVGEGELSSALRAQADMLRANVHERVRTAGEAEDLSALLAKAPGSANLLVRYLRYGAARGAAETLLDQMAETAGPGGLHPSMLPHLREELADHEADAALEPAAADLDDPQLTAFRATYDTWIEPIRFLGRLTGRDQFTRNLIIGQISADLPNEVRNTLVEANAALIDTIDEENAAAVFAILDQYGFEEMNLGAPRAARAIASIIQHATLEDQQRLLPLIEPLALEDAFDGQTYALMFDRVAVRSNRPQRYGSQFDCMDGAYQPLPIEDEAGVDARRAEMGMAPLSEYRAGLIEMYGELC